MTTIHDDLIERSVNIRWPEGFDPAHADLFAHNAVVINAIQLKNTMSGEFLTVNFLSATAIPAGTVRDVVIDCGAMTAVCTQS